MDMLQTHLLVRCLVKVKQATRETVGAGTQFYNTPVPISGIFLVNRCASLIVLAR